MSEPTAPASSSSPANSAPLPAAPRGLLAKLSRLKGPITGIAAVGAVLGGLMGYYNTFNAVKSAALPSASGAANAGLAQGAAIAATDAINPVSVMVLPFANQTGDPAKAYIADGLTSSITADMSRIRDAFIAPTSTAMSFQGKNLPLQQLGREAGVRFILTGSVQASADQVRISAQLADASTGSQMWSETFTGELSQLFDLQDQVTTRIGNSIGPEMVITAAQDSARKRSAPQVADLILQARAGLLQPITLANTVKAETLLRQVLAASPNHAEATGLLAFTLIRKYGNFKSNLEPGQLAPLLAEAKELVERAVALDPNLPFVNTLLGSTLRWSGDAEGAHRAFERQVQLTPKAGRAFNSLGLALTDLVEPELAIAAFKKALALDPARPGLLSNNLALAYVQLGDLEEALRWSDQCAQLNPAYAYCIDSRVLAYSFMGRMDEAKAAAALTLKLAPGYRIALELPTRSSSTAKQKAFWEKAQAAARAAGLPP